jgi:hypothetical protein
MVQGLLNGEPVAFTGRRYHVTGHAIYPLAI